MTSDRQIREEVLAELLAGYETPDDLLGQGGILEHLTKALVERALGAEVSHHLGYEKGQGRQQKRENQRNGSSSKRVLTEHGALELEVPRAHAGTFEPQLVPKGERRLRGVDERIIALYARGMTVREIQAFLAEQDGVEVSPDLISSVTDAVLEEVKEWQNRPLERLYPVVVFDALRVKSGMRAWARGTSKRQSIWHWPCAAMVTRRCWGCGSNRRKGLSSGCA
jgi:transposase-like protein